MKNPSRRKWITSGIAGVAGVSSIAAAARLAREHGLLPPDAIGPYAPGNCLNYAAHRLFARDALAREFPRDQISAKPFANGKPPEDEKYVRSQQAGFTDWRLAIDGLVSRPAAFSVAGLRALPSRSHITSLTCEEGWTYIAEWTGAPLADLLELAGASPKARYVVYYSHQSDWWDSVDIDEARHPQTLIAHTLNGADLPPGNGGPLRMRVPRQLGYKSVKYITRITVTDDIKSIGNGLGGASPQFGYAWFSGI
jgi:DMSO/TMAO reductase YedYZ molybdopterin-dependent catalytic subunit